MGQPLKLLTVLVARFPISVIIISALLVALSLTGAQLSLGFRTSRSDLLNPKSENNRRWAEFTDEFGEQDDVTIVVYSRRPQGRAADPRRARLATQSTQSPAQTLPRRLSQDMTSPGSGPRASITIKSAAIPPADQRLSRPVTGPLAGQRRVAQRGWARSPGSPIRSIGATPRPLRGTPRSAPRSDQGPGEQVAGDPRAQALSQVLEDLGQSQSPLPGDVDPPGPSKTIDLAPVTSCSATVTMSD